MIWYDMSYNRFDDFLDRLFNEESIPENIDFSGGYKVDKIFEGKKEYFDLSRIYRQYFTD